MATVIDNIELDETNVEQPEKQMLKRQFSNTKKMFKETTQQLQS